MPKQRGTGLSTIDYGLLCAVSDSFYLNTSRLIPLKQNANHCRQPAWSSECLRLLSNTLGIIWVSADIPESQHAALRIEMGEECVAKK